VQEAEQPPAAAGSDLAAAAALEVDLDRSSDHPDQVEIPAAAVASSQAVPSSELEHALGSEYHQSSLPD
jgi:hypothetical protein